MLVFLGLGSNLGDRARILASATDSLSCNNQVIKQSAVYETLPALGPPQPNYLNAALLLQTSLDPFDFLESLFVLESQHGRRRRPDQRNFPRFLDLDILLLGAHGQEVIKTERLEVPHPRMAQRTIVLAPLLDIDQHLVHPTLHMSLKNIYKQLLISEPPPVQISPWIVPSIPSNDSVK